MEALTPAERRGALVVVLLLALGAGHDLWRGAAGPAPDGGAGSPGRSPAVPAGPEAGAAPAGGSGPIGSPAGPASAGAIVDLNRASRQELEALPGIGPVLAARIVSQRERHGPFRTREELLAVRGIGPRLLARLRPHVGVAPPIAPDDSVGRADRAPAGRRRGR